MAVANERAACTDSSQNYPEAPGYVAGSATSAAATQQITGKAKALGAQILDLLRDHPAGLTADQVAHGLGLKQPYAARPRLAELHRRGEISDSGQRRPGTSGIAQVVWKIAQPLPSEQRASA